MVCDKGVFRCFSQGSFEEIETLAKLISGKIKHAPKVGIVCGSGLGGLVEMVEDKHIIKYSELDGFPVSTGRLTGKEERRATVMFV